MDREKSALKKNTKIMEPWILQLRALYILAYTNAIVIRMVESRPKAICIQEIQISAYLSDENWKKTVRLQMKMFKSLTKSIYK